MNHLAHFKLAAATPDLLVGNVLADFVKGRLTGHYPASVERGIRLHRAIDAFTDSHPVILASHRHLDPGYGRYGGIITDIIFDHFLAIEWQRFDSRALNEFCETSLRQVLCLSHLLSPAAVDRMEHMLNHRSMQQYTQTDFIKRSFIYLSGRLKRDNPLHLAYGQFEQHNDALKQAFDSFFPELEDFARDWLETNNLQEPMK